MFRMFTAVSLLACVACQRHATADDNARPGPSDKVPELKAIDHYAGTWDVEMTSTGHPFTKGKVTAKWILDGRYLQQTGELLADDGSPVMKHTSLMTYDPTKKVYRSWIFLSDGTAGESDATWDEKRQIMTSVGRKDENGVFSTTTADFSQAGVEKWKMVIKDSTGKVVSEMSGKNSRKK